jgi:hypothetical protein
MQSTRARPRSPSEPPKRPPSRLALGTLLTLSVMLGFGLVELGLRVLTPFPIHADGANRDPHDALGYVVSPAFADIDAHGFRNPEGADRAAEVFALGDSHTFGQNVSAAQSWPSQLARLTGLRVYNYGVGGYGILQYAYLFERALERRPDHIIVGLYLANDFARFCEFANRPYWREKLATQRIATVECDRPTSATSSIVEAARDLLKATALGSALIYHVWYPLEARLAERGVDATAWALRYGPDGQHQTLLSTSRIETGGRVMDRSQPAVAVADRAARSLFQAMAREAERQSVAFSILLIPSKENVIFDSLPNSTPHRGAVRDLVEQERELIQDYREFFASIGVRTANALDASSAQLESQDLYPDSIDSHPLAAGYRAYAEAALALVSATPDADPERPAGEPQRR